MNKCIFPKPKFVVLFFLILFFGVVATAQSKTEKSEFKTTLDNYQKAWNMGDAEGVADCFHQDAKIMTGKRKDFVTTEEYRKIHLPKRIKRYPHVKFTSFKFKKEKNHAVVIAVTKYKGLSRKIRFHFKMIRENDQWLITEQKY